MIGDLYDWSGVSPEVRGRPFQPPPLFVHVVIHLADGTPVTVTREVTYRYADQARGEIRRPVWVMPRVGVKVEPSLIVWPSADTNGRDVTVELQNNGAPASGRVRLALDGWGPPPQSVTFERRGEATTVTFHVRRPAGFRSGTVHGRAVFELGGAEYDDGDQVIDYSHVRPTVWNRDASMEIRVAPIALPEAGRIAYIRGASDRVPEALAAIGVPVTLLDAHTLAEGDLSRFGVIVVGIRAYETDSALVRHNDRLLAYVRNGGHLVVQYQQYQFSRGGYAPYSIEISRPHDRITDENAPVRLLVPEHPIFTQPNRIGPPDWDGWPQERGLYFGGTWDSHYTPLLEMTDPGMAPVDGGLLVTHYGKGTYIYTGISFFRSLPAGVPGAARLFMNLLAWKG